MEVKYTKYWGSSRKRGKQYPNVKKFGNPFIAFGSRLSRPTEAKVWSTGGDTVFVLRVRTTNHVRDNANLEAKYSGRGGVSNFNSLLCAFY